VRKLDQTNICCVTGWRENRRYSKTFQHESQFIGKSSFSSAICSSRARTTTNTRPARTHFTAPRGPPRCCHISILVSICLDTESSERVLPNSTGLTSNTAFEYVAGKLGAPLDECEPQESSIVRCFFQSLTLPFEQSSSSSCSWARIPWLHFSSEYRTTSPI
jgi:hypothetical protein